MARPLNKLTARKVASLTKPGRHSDGGGLYLRITPKGAKSWVFMTTRRGKRAEIGLGGFSAVGLAKAREIASEMRELSTLGRNPRDALSAPEVEPKQQEHCFGEFAEEYIRSVEAGWKNPTHRKQWRNSLRDHAALLKEVPLDQIDTDQILEVLQPIWLRLPETASRVRGRIERILDAAKARELLSRDAANPARWKGHLELLLPKQQKRSRGHHPALDYQAAPAFMKLLKARSALSARCLEFTILTAARSGEALGATWSEIDLDKRIWRVPAERMKANAEHVVPLSNAAIDLLQSIHQADAGADTRVFSINGAARSNMAMSMLLRRMDYGHITTHGFRSTFRDWAGDCTQHPREIIEAALAHTISNKAEAAYRRRTAVERRRALMEDWASFLSGSSGTS